MLHLFTLQHNCFFLQHSFSLLLIMLRTFAPSKIAKPIQTLKNYAT